MKKAIKITGALFCILLGQVIAFIVNLAVENLIIPDPCAYHGEKTTKLFDLFYKMTSDEGYHPSPTTFNYLLTLTLGGSLGIFLYKKLIA